MENNKEILRTKDDRQMWAESCNKICAEVSFISNKLVFAQ